MNPQNISSASQHFNPLETVRVDSKKVSCDGGKGFSKHPLVYLNMGKNDFVICPYCSKFFTTKKNSSPVIMGLKNQMKEEE